ncbi:hypothetical protein OH76DRAFT_1490624 [Lentinus brumalis]|uniref:Uncharacterized protein n=1 Tax=Lentinus brumalis TaxID=2498619 RepID=A0A371CIB8_9APHY|nr:hypothetical protein OH76DRAFT_1490624 [Polyporus brumalis]
MNELVPAAVAVAVRPLLGAAARRCHARYAASSRRRDSKSEDAATDNSVEDAACCSACGLVEQARFSVSRRGTHLLIPRCSCSGAPH